MFDTQDIAFAENLLALCRGKGLRIATAESCTGGLVAAILTEIPGSSDVFERAFVTYSNAAKSQALGVSGEIIATHGAVSAEVAQAMARGALEHSAADIAVAVTGIAGPGGGSAEKPVGLVFLAVARAGEIRVIREQFGGSRTDIRRQSMLRALELLHEAAEAGLTAIA